MKDLIVVALGGNAIISAKQKGTTEEQFENVGKTTKHLAQLVKEGYGLVIGHGNGPQVGNLLIQHDAAKDKVPALSMDVCGAQSQGQIGYMIQQTLQNHFVSMGMKKQAVTLVTQVEVDEADPAFESPSKPVGPFYDEAKGKELMTAGFDVIEDAGRGWRRVVASPQPKAIVEIEAVRELIEAGVIVTCSGGGGIPVVREDKKLRGVEAVIDKDRASELLAQEVRADRFVILTDVEKVAINFNTPKQKDLDTMTIAEAEKYMKAGHFAKGSMLPKVEAAVKFIKWGGKSALITHPFRVLDALEGKTGTLITK